MAPHQRAEEAADGACGLAQGAVLLQKEGDELVGLRRALQAGWRLHSGRSRQLPQEPDPSLKLSPYNVPVSKVTELGQKTRKLW